MSSKNESWIVKNGPWIALPIVALAAFLLGGRLLGGSDTSSPKPSSVAEQSKDRLWTCSMHPQIQQHEPGQCPICGMDLISVEKPSSEGDGNARQVSLSERARVLARIRTTPAQRLDSGKVERRLLGRVDYDERSLRTVTAWIGGRIERLHVSTTGERVKRGQVIATLYSPEVYNSHQDLIQARQQLERLQSGATPSARRAAEAALDAARDRLRLIGVPGAEVRSMERAAKPSERVRIRTPFGGTVIERLATQGNYVETGSGLYRVADLSRLWVQLDAYESDLPVLHSGQDVTIRVEALPGETFQGRVTFVDPVLDPKTRTARVRIEVKNQDRRLRPGMFVEANVQSAAGADASKATPQGIPATAPLFSGRRSVVYVEANDQDAPTYEAREVTLGPRMGELYPVLSGLDEGDRVVVHGAFAIDADLQIRGGESMMNLPAASDASSKPKPKMPAHQGHPH